MFCGQLCLVLRTFRIVLFRVHFFLEFFPLAALPSPFQGSSSSSLPFSGLFLARLWPFTGCFSLDVPALFDAAGGVTLVSAEEEAAEGLSVWFGAALLFFFGGSSSSEDSEPEEDDEENETAKGLLVFFGVDVFAGGSARFFLLAGPLFSSSSEDRSEEESSGTTFCRLCFFAAGGGGLFLVRLVSLLLLEATPESRLLGPLELAGVESSQVEEHVCPPLLEGWLDALWNRRLGAGQPSDWSSSSLSSSSSSHMETFLDTGQRLLMMESSK